MFGKPQGTWIGSLRSRCGERMMARKGARAGLAVVATALIGTAAQAAEGDPLARYRWTSRILVISAPDAGDPLARAQRDIAAAAKAGMTDRDLVTVEAYGADAASIALRRKLSLPATAFRALLIGKDGEAKLASPEPIPAATLFSTIDTMPMRRDEMRR